MDKIYKIRPENLNKEEAKAFDYMLHLFTTGLVHSYGKTVDIVCENYPGELTRWEKVKALLREIISVIKYGV